MVKMAKTDVMMATNMVNIGVYAKKPEKWRTYWKGIEKRYQIKSNGQIKINSEIMAISLIFWFNFGPELNLKAHAQFCIHFLWWQSLFLVETADLNSGLGSVVMWLSRRGVTTESCLPLKGVFHQRLSLPKVIFYG